MKSPESSHEQLITPEKLQDAFDRLVDSKGKQLLNGDERVLIMASQRHGGAIEDEPFYTLTRSLSHENEAASVYAFGQVFPANGYTIKNITFRPGEAYYRDDQYTQIGTDDWETNDDEKGTVLSEGLLGEEELSAIYDVVSDPNLKTRREAAEDYYAERHARRSLVGRLVARVLKLDESHYVESPF